MQSNGETIRALKYEYSIMKYSILLRTAKGLFVCVLKKYFSNDNLLYTVNIKIVTCFDNLRLLAKHLQG